MYPSITCKADATLADVLSRLASSRIHRIYIVNENSKPIRVVTLSDLLAAMVVPNAD
jgi:CBS-domain-containing membrane protein